MVKPKHYYWNVLEQLLYMYAVLVPHVAATYLCQFSTKCAEQDKSRIPSPINAEGLPNTCCKDCRCRRTCDDIYESCCFPELTNTLDESIETCTYAQSPVPHVEKRYDVFAYYMVDKNPPDGCLDKEFIAQHPEQECGDVDAAYWGSLYPVSSVSTGKIYRNLHCAACHDVTDAKLWQASINLGNYFTDKLEYENGIISFRNIEDNFDFIDRRCFSGRIIKTCPSTAFFIPTTLDMDANAVVSACLGGMFSPYVHEHVYSNTFCLICNNDLRKYHPIQKATCPNEGDNRGFRPFTAILVPSTTTVYKKEQHQLTCIKMYYSQVRPKCRPVLCQSGTVLIDGECQHVTETMYNSDFIVNIVIIPTSFISISQVEMEIGELSNHLVQTWGKQWTVIHVRVSYSLSSKVETILVTLKLSVQQVSTLNLLDQITINLNNSSYWIHNSSNESVHLMPSITLGHEVVSRGTIDELIKNIDEMTDDVDLIKHALNTSKTYKTLFSTPPSSDPFILAKTKTVISEMFYCEQIQLNAYEYVKLSNNIVFIKHLHALLYKYQFIEVPDKNGLGKNIRVCLLESGFGLNIYTSNARVIHKMVTFEMIGLFVVYAFALDLFA